jgi:glucose/arabinose dehydrogenase
VYYTRAALPVKNRVSRFAANELNPDVAVPDEHIILDDIGSDGGNHNGGAIHFGLDGMLYVAIGEGGAIPSNSQTLGNLSGKLLRIEPDGGIPPDNPFVDTPGARGEIWALGLRNPYTFAVDPLTGTIHINDVGQSTWEEVNLGTKGANYGWPECEGVCGDPDFADPIYTYAHDVGRAITGGTFYRAAHCAPPQMCESVTFPTQYSGSYFFADYLGGWIKRLDENHQVSDFWNPQNGPVDLKVGPEGALYYLSIFDSAVYKIQLEDASPAGAGSSGGTLTVIGGKGSLATASKKIHVKK